MDTKERLELLLKATDDKIKLIDSILLGKYKAEPKHNADPDVRTCTKEEAGRRLGVSVSTVRRMVKRGKLDQVVMNKNPRILLSSIIEYDTRQREAS